MTPQPKSDTAECLLGLGSNLGDRKRAIEGALKAIDGLASTELIDVSSLYETPAQFVEDQPDFLNACARISTGLSPRELLDCLLDIEQSMGRVRTQNKGPRIIDLDILFYADRIVDEERLTIPHPDLHNRRFVLEPLAEIAADFTHPLQGMEVAELLGKLGDGPRSDVG